MISKGYFSTTKMNDKKKNNSLELKAVVLADEREMLGLFLGE